MLQDVEQVAQRAGLSLGPNRLAEVVQRLTNVAPARLPDDSETKARAVSKPRPSAPPPPPPATGQETRLAPISTVLAPMLVGIVSLTLLGPALDALSMGDDEARALGVPVTAVRYFVILAATLVSALSVSIAGIIGWVGLVVPNFARLLFGPSNSRLLPLSAILGALFLLCADCIARVAAPHEIPIGIVTELLGIPAFILVLGRARRAWL